MSEWILKNDFASSVMKLDPYGTIEVQRESGRYDIAKPYDVKWGDVVAYRVINPGTKSTEQANDRQISGNHYMKQQVQPWDYIASNGLGFFEGNIVKYVTRWKDKGGVDDLKKAQHYLQKLIEIQQ